jgi:hypothetical protein
LSQFSLFFYAIFDRPEGEQKLTLVVRLISFVFYPQLWVKRNWLFCRSAIPFAAAISCFMADLFIALSRLSPLFLVNYRVKLLSYLSKILSQFVLSQKFLEKPRGILSFLYIIGIPFA